MEKQVVFRDRQELQSADLNNIQGYTADSLQHLTQDAVSTGLHFTGGLVSAVSATEISVAALRFFNDGKVYVAEQEQTLNLFQYMPLVAKKCVAVVLWGQETDTLVEPRDFLIDLTTGATQPQAVAMQRLNACNVNLLPGSESADPQPPVIQTNTLAVALVYLTPTGIERVEMQDRARLPNMADHEERLFEVETWRSQAEPRISSIATDLSALANKTLDLAPRSVLVEMAGDIGRLKDKLNLPSAFASYQSDTFATTDYTDETVDGFIARVDNGLQFPFAAQAVAPLQLFNPYDAAIYRTADDLVLPAFDSAVRIETKGYSGDLSISQYQVQTQTLRAYTTTRKVWHYGYGYNYYSYWWRNAWYSVNRAAYYYPNVRRYGYYTTETDTHYALETTTTSYNGVIIGQSLLVANAMWLTKVGLFFTQIAAAGDVMLAVCETDGGKPDIGKTLTRVTVPVASLKKYPLETTIDVPPVQLDAGKRYALVLITQGNHRVATVSGNNYTQGTLFYGSDGDYFSGDLTKDLMFKFYGAQFRQARTEIMLQPVSLAGGIADLHVDAQAVIPAGTELRYEIQVGGRWYPLGDEVFRLADLPDIVPIRVVLLGTQDAAPALQLAADVLTASRPAITFTHYSAERQLAAPSSNIQVQVVAAQWEAANHTLDCVLIADGTTYTPSVTTSKLEPDGEATRITFTFAPNPGLSTYRVKLSGSRNAAANPFVVVERTDVSL